MQRPRRVEIGSVEVGPREQSSTELEVVVDHPSRAHGRAHHEGDPEGAPDEGPEVALRTTRHGCSVCSASSAAIVSPGDCASRSIDENAGVTHRSLLGVVHLEPLPSAAEFGGSFDRVLELALADADALAKGGIDGIVVENFGDAPFHRGDAADPVRPDVVAALAVVAREVRRATNLPVGVNCLRNDAHAALGAAAVSGAKWIRVNVLTGSYVTDQGTIDGDAARIAEYRRLVAPDVKLLADLMVKHAAPVAPLDPVAAARDLAERSGADGIIVSGSRTGEAVDAEFLTTVRDAVDGFPVWIGSGLDESNAARLWPRCSGAIVGTAFKRDGRVWIDKVRSLRTLLDSLD
ncbi:MAG: BtpA/SgcQ family protein [Planctomycetes bacterium]|nr:BtpA/SgcQ family protein [Planctomycetota bacterium]